MKVPNNQATLLRDMIPLTLMITKTSTMKTSLVKS